MRNGSRPSFVGPLAVAVLLIALTAGIVNRDRLRSAYVRWRHPHIVLVTFDTLNIRYTGAYNPKRHTTPNLDAIVREGVRVRRAYTTVPITLPSHTAMWSGRHPVATGVMRNGDQVPHDLPLLPELLRDRGYRTAGFISLGVLQSSFGIARGFETYDEDLATNARWYRTADEVVLPAMRWLEGIGESPFLLWVHLSDPHEPYQAKGAPPDLRVSLDGVQVAEVNVAGKEAQALPLTLAPGKHRLIFELLPPWDAGPSWLRLRLVEGLALYRVVPPRTPDTIEVDPRHSIELRNPGVEPALVTLRFDGALKNPPGDYVRAQYEAEVAFADAQLGRLRELLAARGLEPSTLWVIASDHGEGLFHHDLVGHAAYTREDQLRAMFILKGPGIPEGRLVEGPVLLEDLAPTVLDVLGLPAIPGADGRSMRPCWTWGGDCQPRTDWWAYGIGEENQDISSVAGYHWPYKVHWLGQTRSVHQLVADPFEATDLSLGGTAAATLPAAASALLGELPARRKELNQALDHRGEGRVLMDEEKEALRSLGYLR